MRKLIFIFYLLFILDLFAIGQTLEIKTIKLSQYNLGADYEPYYEDHWGGPSIELTFLLINNSPDEIFLAVDHDSVELSFRHDYKEYVESLVARFPFSDRNTKLQTNDTITIQIRSRILLGTGLFRKPGEDYRNTLLQVLPTLSVRYYASSSSIVIGNRNKIDVILKE